MADKLGLDLEIIADQLLAEEVQRSIEVFEQLLRMIQQKRQILRY
jgi:hypothetical protein